MSEWQIVDYGKNWTTNEWNDYGLLVFADPNPHYPISFSVSWSIIGTLDRTYYHGRGFASSVNYETGVGTYTNPEIVTGKKSENVLDTGWYSYPYSATEALRVISFEARSSSETECLIIGRRYGAPATPMYAYTDVLIPFDFPVFDDVKGFRIYVQSSNRHINQTAGMAIYIWQYNLTNDDGTGVWEELTVSPLDRLKTVDSDGTGRDWDVFNELFELSSNPEGWNALEKNDWGWYIYDQHRQEREFSNVAIRAKGIKVSRGIRLKIQCIDDNTSDRGSGMNVGHVYAQAIRSGGETNQYPITSTLPQAVRTDESSILTYVLAGDFYVICPSQAIIFDDMDHVDYGATDYSFTFDDRTTGEFFIGTDFYGLSHLSTLDILKEAGHYMWFYDSTTQNLVLENRDNLIDSGITFDSSILNADNCSISYPKRQVIDKIILKGNPTLDLVHTDTSPDTLTNQSTRVYFESMPHITTKGELKAIGDNLFLRYGNLFPSVVVSLPYTFTYSAVRIGTYVTVDYSTISSQQMRVQRLLYKYEAGKGLFVTFYLGNPQSPDPIRIRDEINKQTRRINEIFNQTSYINYNSGDYVFASSGGGSGGSGEFYYVQTDGSTPLSADWDVGAHSIRMVSARIDGGITDYYIELIGTPTGNRTIIFPDHNLTIGLTQVELDQLELINSVTIDNTQWGYLGELDQSLTQASTPSFTGVTLTGDLALEANSITGTTVDINNVELQQLSLIGATTISSTQWGYLGSLDQGLTTGSNVGFAQITMVNAINEFSIDDTLSGGSDSAVPTEQAVKGYVDTITGGAVIYWYKTFVSTVENVVASSAADTINFASADGRLTIVGTAATDLITFSVIDSVIDHNSLLNTHNLTTSIDHNTITNNHNLTTDIDHNSITNTHNLTTAIDHNTITNAHNLTTDINHDTVAGFVLAEHLSLPNTIVSVLSDHTQIWHDHDQLTNTHNLTTNIDHDTITNTHNLTTAIDHNSITNTHNLTTNIDHNTITNNHNLTTDIDHDTITNNHNLTTDIDHDTITNTHQGVDTSDSPSFVALTITAGNLLMNGSGTDNERLRAPYLTAIPSSVDNGSIWLEADGLHVYYGGAEDTITSSGTPHTLDSATHSDVTAMTEVLSDLLYWDGANWNNLSRGSDNQILRMNGTALNWETGTGVDGDDLGSHTATQDVNMATFDIENLGTIYHDDDTHYLCRVTSDGTDGGTLHDIGLYWDTTNNYLHLRGYTQIRIDAQTTNVIYATSTEVYFPVGLTMAGTLNLAGQSLIGTGYSLGTAELGWLEDIYDTGVTSGEFDHLDGVSSSIQTQLNGKAPTSHTMASHSDETTYNISTSGTFAFGAAAQNLNLAGFSLTGTGYTLGIGELGWLEDIYDTNVLPAEFDFIDGLNQFLDTGKSPSFNDLTLTGGDLTLGSATPSVYLQAKTLGGETEDVYLVYGDARPALTYSTWAFADTLYNFGIAFTHDDTPADSTARIYVEAVEYRFDTAAFYPDDDNLRDLGKTSQEWKDLYLDGTAHIDTLDVDGTAAITTSLQLGGGAVITTLGDTAALANSDVKVPTNTTVKEYVDALSPDVTPKPYTNLVSINSRKAFLLFEDDYSTGAYNDLEKPVFWSIASLSDAAENATNLFRIENTSGYLRWYSLSDTINTHFDLSAVGAPRQIVIEFENFNYDDVGGADYFNGCTLYWNHWQTTVLMQHGIALLNGKHNVYYHYPSGVETDTGWGNPETLGDHTLRFFVAIDSYTTGLPIRYRIECTGKTAVTGTRADIITADETERFMGWGRMWTSPTRSSGWDIDASLEVLRIYARDNDDL